MFAPVTVRRSLSRAARAHAPEDAQARGDRVPVLDGLRGLAIILVFLAHAIREPLQPGTASIDVALRAIAYTGWIGVDLFFVLSGFLISGILLDTRGQPRWWPNFIVRRALRIFPLYYGALTVLFVFLPWLVRWSNPDFVTLQANQRWYWTYTVNLLAALTDGRGTPLYTSHLWSLSIEEQFYLIWPFFVWVCRPRTLLRVAALAVIAGLAFRLGLVLHDPLNGRAAYWLMPGRLDSLMTGAALAVLARSPGGLLRLAPLAPLGLGAGVFALCALVLSRGGLDVRDPVVAIAVYPVVALVFGSLLVMALTAPPTGALVRALSCESLGKWGKYSYAIYLVHYPLLAAIESKTTFYQREVALLGGSRLPSVLLLAALTMALSYLLGWLSYHLYEKRFLSLKRYFTCRPTVRDESTQQRETEHARGSRSFARAS